MRRATGASPVIAGDLTARHPTQVCTHTSRNQSCRPAAIRIAAADTTAFQSPPPIPASHCSRQIFLHFLVTLNGDARSARFDLLLDFNPAFSPAISSSRYRPNKLFCSVAVMSRAATPGNPVLAAGRFPPPKFKRRPTGEDRLQNYAVRSWTGGSKRLRRRFLQSSSRRRGRFHFQSSAATITATLYSASVGLS